MRYSSRHNIILRTLQRLALAPCRWQCPWLLITRVQPGWRHNRILAIGIRSESRIDRSSRIINNNSRIRSVMMPLCAVLPAPVVVVARVVAVSVLWIYVSIRTIHGWRKRKRYRVSFFHRRDDEVYSVVFLFCLSIPSCSFLGKVRLGTCMYLMKESEWDGMGGKGRCRCRRFLMSSALDFRLCCVDHSYVVMSCESSGVEWSGVVWCGVRRFVSFRLSLSLVMCCVFVVSTRIGTSFDHITSLSSFLLPVAVSIYYI